jgi:UPF0755 protein
MIKKLGIFTFVVTVFFFLLFFYKGNVANEYSLKLREPTTINAVRDSLRAHSVIENTYIFDLVHLIYEVKSVPAGHYRLKKSMTSFDILRKLKFGRQDPIRWTISTATFVEELAGKAADKLGMDSLDFIRVIYDSTQLRQRGYSKENALALFLPNTYEFYWNISPEDLLTKINKETEKFWNAERMAKAQKLNLQPAEVYILASLVQKEYTRKDERSKIAGVLINRMKINMPLQVDATCKYATRDFAAKRVNYYHTQYNSPYNTYKIIGLPPGPICMPELSTLDAVLMSEAHDYIYYCADPSLNGYHLFSCSLAEHESIASSYHRKMNELKIQK